MNKKKVITATAVTALTAAALIGSTELNANLLSGMQLNVSPTIQPGKSTSNNAGPQVVESREELNKPQVNNPVPQVKPDTVKPDVPKTEEQKDEDSVEGEEGKEEVEGEESEEEVAPYQSRYNPGDIIEIGPGKVAQDNWLTQEIARQNGVSVGALTQQHFDNVTELVLENQNLSTMPEEFYNLFNLQVLDLSGNVFSEIPDLRNQDRLVTIDMSNNRLTVTNMNADVSSVRNVDFSNNAIVNLGNLGSFVHIQNLNISNNRMSHIDDVANLRRLQTLNFANNHVVNINPIKDCNEIVTLNASYNKIIDVTPLTKTKTLETLLINNNRLTEVNCIDRSNVNLRTLDMSNNSVSDMNPVGMALGLTTLRADNNLIEDVKPLVNLDNVTTLSLDNNLIYDVEAVGEMASLSNWSVREQRTTFTVDKVVNSDLEIKNPVTYFKGDKIDPNYISDEGKVNRNRIKWLNLKQNQTYFTAEHSNFSVRADVKVAYKPGKGDIENAWDNNVPRIQGADDITIKTTDYNVFDLRAGVRATDNEDGDLTSKMKISGTVDPNKAGVYRIVYEVTDSDGAIATVNRTITVLESFKPEILAPNEVTIKAGDDFKLLDEEVEALDREDGVLTPVIKVIKNDVNTTKPGDYAIKLSVTDSDNHTTFKDIKVKTVRNSVPQLVGVVDKTIKVGDDFDSKAGIEAIDAEDGNITSMIAIGGTVDTDRAGSYTLEYSVVDRDGNAVRAQRTIKVVKGNTAPEISGLATVNLFENEVNDWDPMEGVEAHDLEDGRLTSKVKITGNVDSREGRYQLTYHVTDSENVKTEEVRTVNVKSNQKPTLVGIADETIHISKEQGFDAMQGITAMDKEDGDLTAEIKVTGAVDQTKVGTYKLTYSVTDSQKNTTTQTKTVTVISNKPPVINGGGSNATAPGQLPSAPSDGGAVSGNTRKDTVFQGDLSYNVLDGVSVSDDNDASISLEVIGTVDVDTIGKYTVKIVATDSDGNQTVMVKEVNVVSNTAPIIKFPKQTVLELNVDFDLMQMVEVFDDHDKNLVSKVMIDDNDGFTTTKAGIYNIRYSVKDSQGNVTKATRLIEVRDPKVAPILYGVEDKEIMLDEKFDKSFGVYAKDDKDDQATLTRAIEIKGDVDITMPGEYKLIYSVSDSDGNITQAIRTVTVKLPPHGGVAVGDMPLLKGINDEIVYQYSFRDPMQGVTAEDRQDGDITKDIKLIADNVNTDVPGTYLSIYEVSDSESHTVRATKVTQVVGRPDGKQYCSQCGAPGCHGECKTCSPVKKCGVCSTCCPPKAPTSNCIPNAPVSGGLPKTGTVASPGIMVSIGAVITSGLAWFGFKRKK